MNPSPGPGMARTVFLVARHELLLRIRGKVFSIGTLIAIALIAVYVVVQLAVLNHLDTSAKYNVGYTPPTQTLARSVQTASAALHARVELRPVADMAGGEAAVRAGSLDAVLAGSDDDAVVVVRSGLAQPLSMALTAVVRQRALDAQLRSAGLDPVAVQRAVAAATFSVRTLQPVPPNAAEGPIVGAVLAFLLYTFLGIYGGLIAQSVVAEKASRVVETLLATVRARDLLLGKVIGVGLAAALQFGAILGAALALTIPTHVLAVSGTAVGAVLAGLLWFVLGYLLYATLLAGVASLVSRVEEVNAATLPVTLLLVVGWLLAYVVIIPEISLATTGALPPAGARTVGTVASLVPLFSPVLMPIRMAANDAALWQVLLAVGLTLLAIAGSAVLGGRIYMSSVLRFGARIRLRDALRTAD